MKRKPLTHAARLLCVLALSMSLTPAAFAAAPSEPTQPSPLLSHRRHPERGRHRDQKDVRPGAGG